MSVAQLGFAIDSSQAAGAAADLDKLTSSAAKAEQAAQRTGAAGTRMNPPVTGGSIPLSDRVNWAAYAQMYRDMVTADPALTLIDLAPGWAGVTVSEIPDGVHPTKAAVSTRSVPTMISSLRPLIS